MPKQEHQIRVFVKVPIGLPIIHSSLAAGFNEAVRRSRHMLCLITPEMHEHDSNSREGKMTAKPKSWSLSAWIAVMAFFCLESVAHAQFPVEIWDLHINGGAVAGLGHLDFGIDGVVKGFLLLRPKTNTKMANPPSVINFGFFPVLGAWNFEPSGRVVGFFSGGSEEVPLDVSFTAKGNDSKIKIHATSNDGRMSLTGRPVSDTVAPDLDGTSWSARVKKDGLLFTELYDLFQSGPVCVSVDNSDPENPVCLLETDEATNLYDVIGGGPGYVVVGKFLRSWAKQIAIAITELEIDKDTGEVAENGNGRGATGRITPQETSNMLAGDEEHTKVHMAIKQSP
jgi:hypothetical protein